MVSKDVLMRNLRYTLKLHYFKVINIIRDDFNATKLIDIKIFNF
jgi:hypothetical protein